MGGANTKHARALALRDAALIIVKRDGAWRDWGPAKVLFAQSDGISIAHRTPFQKLPEVSDLTKYEAARLGAQLNLPYGLDIWAPKRVLNIEWDDQGRVALLSLRSGAWEADLMAVAAGSARPVSWISCGRRAGKDSVASEIAAYIASMMEEPR